MEQVANTTISKLVSPSPNLSKARYGKPAIWRGSAILLFSTGLVSATNLLYNHAICARSRRSRLPDMPPRSTRS